MSTFHFFTITVNSFSCEICAGTHSHRLHSWLGNNTACRAHVCLEMKVHSALRRDTHTHARDTLDGDYPLQAHSDALSMNWKGKSPSRRGLSFVGGEYLMLTLQQFGKTVLLRRHISFAFTPVILGVFFLYYFYFPPVASAYLMLMWNQSDSNFKTTGIAYSPVIEVIISAPGC